MKFFFSQVKRELLYKLRKKWSRRQWPNLPQPKCLFLREPGGVEEAAQVTAPQRTPKLRHQLQVQNAFCLVSRVSTTGTRNLLDELIMSPGLFRPGSKWCFGHNMLPPIFSYLLYIGGGCISSSWCHQALAPFQVWLHLPISAKWIIFDVNISYFRVGEGERAEWVRGGQTPRFIKAPSTQTENKSYKKQTCQAEEKRWGVFPGKNPVFKYHTSKSAL